MLIQKVESNLICERSEQTYSLRSKLKTFYSYQNSRAKIFYLRDCARVARARADFFGKTSLILRVRVRVRDLRARALRARAQEILARSSLCYLLYNSAFDSIKNLKFSKNQEIAPGRR